MPDVDFALQARRAARRIEARRRRDRALGRHLREFGPPQPPRETRQCSSCPFATRALCDEWKARRA